jgi:filamentous hemagglutinin
MSTIELIVLLVLVVTLGVSLWNFFGNDLACRLAEVTERFNQAHASPWQCTEGASSGRAASKGSTRAGQTGGASSPTSQGASRRSSKTPTTPTTRATPTTPTTRATPTTPTTRATQTTSTTQTTPTQDTPAPTPQQTAVAAPTDDDEVLEPETIGSRVGRALTETGHQVVDFTQGVIVGLVPGAATNPNARPSYHHEQTFGAGEVVGAALGLPIDHALGQASLTLGSAAIVAAPETAGASLAVVPVAAAGATAAVAAAGGHGLNLNEGMRDLIHGDNTPVHEAPPERAVDTGKGWKVGDDVQKPTAAGSEPSWSTQRARFWKNEAAKEAGTGKYSPEQLERMAKGRAPQRYNPDKPGVESMELSHEPTPQREGGKEVVPRWPQDHAKVDPFRRPGY